MKARADPVPKFPSSTAAAGKQATAGDAWGLRVKKEQREQRKGSHMPSDLMFRIAVVVQSVESSGDKVGERRVVDASAARNFLALSYILARTCVMLDHADLACKWLRLHAPAGLRGGGNSVPRRTWMRR